jgi:acyl carrier protein
MNDATIPSPIVGTYDQGGEEAPRGETERQIARMWQELFHLEQVGRNANFFELGGDSLLAMKLVAKLATNLGIRLPIVAAFQYPTVAQIAFLVQSHSWNNVSPSGSAGPALDVGLI